MQSTHNSAAQASAARLIRVLRKTYPHVITAGSSHATAGGGAAATAETGTAQGYLCAYLAHLVDPTKPFTRNLRLHRDPSIASTIRVIDFIKNKQAANEALEMLLSIAQTYPGGRKWTDDDAHWSMNKIYNPQSQQMEEIIATPAEVLNLYISTIRPISQGCVTAQIELRPRRCAWTTVSEARITQTLFSPLTQ